MPDRVLAPCTGPRPNILPGEMWILTKPGPSLKAIARNQAQMSPM